WPWPSFIRTPPAFAGVGAFELTNPQLERAHLRRLQPIGVSIFRGWPGRPHAPYAQGRTRAECNVHRWSAANSQLSSNANARYALLARPARDQRVGIFLYRG